MITVLYVDDEADTEKMASKFEIMRSLEVEAIPVTDVDRVLPTIQEIGEDKIRLLVLDIIMPPLDTYSLEETTGGTSTGIRLLKDIKIACPNLPILIVSVRRIYDIDREFNVKDYLEKPVSAQKLADTIKRIVSGAESESS